MPWSYQYDWSVYDRVPDDLTEKYLERLMLPRQLPSRAYLDRLVDAHQRIIPFENLDAALWNRPVSLEPERMMEKLLVKRRGGYCFELNGLFSLLLKQLGFDAWLCPCRQLRHQEPSLVPATHCCLLVHLDGQALFCDVGYGGPMPRGSIEMKTGVPQEVRGERYLFRESRTTADEAFCGWYDLIWRPAGAEGEGTPLIQAAPVRAHLMDFYGANLLRSTGDTRYGVLHAARNTEDGFIDLTDRKLTIRSGQDNTEYPVKPEDLPRILREYFDIG